MNESKSVAYAVAFEALGLLLYVLPAYDVYFSQFTAVKARTTAKHVSGTKIT